MPDDILYRVVRMTFREDKGGDFLQIFEESKQKIRQFEGCLHLELWQDPDREHIFTSFSIWESARALQTYRRSEVFRAIWGKTKSLFASPAVAYSYRKIGDV